MPAPAAIGAADDGNRRSPMPIASTEPASQAAPRGRVVPSTSRAIVGGPHGAASTTGDDSGGRATGIDARVNGSPPVGSGTSTIGSSSGSRVSTGGPDVTVQKLDVNTAPSDT